MSPLLLQLIFFGALAAGANVVGGLVLLPTRLRRNYRRLLKYLLAVGAGFMLAVTIFEILPRSVTLWASGADGDSLGVPMALILAGYLLTQFLEHTVAPHFHLGEEMHCEEEDHSHDLISARSAYTAVGGLLVHTFFDGVSIAAASQIDSKVGLLVFIAILMHKFPEGFTVGSMVLAAGKGSRQVMITTSLLGLTTFMGVIIFYFIGTNFGSVNAYALPLAGGVTLYVAASDLIPEVNHHHGVSVWGSLAIFLGVALFFVTHMALHAIVGD
jgi:zinc transporter ZupT